MLLCCPVTIPHGGLGTLVPRIVSSLHKSSPSHAVGLEQKKLYTFVSLFLDFLMSPSHIVGLKHLPKSLKIQALTLSKFKQPTGRAH